MKKQNNIFTYIAKITYSVALITSLYSCTDEEIIKKSNVEEGIPTEISMNYATPGMTSISTRGVSEEQENQVSDLYVLIFDRAGNKKSGQLFKDPGSGITINTTSGESYIYGIANVINNQQEDLKSKLDAVKSISELNTCFVKTIIKDGFIDVDRTSPNLLMSGAFNNGIASDKGKGDGYCVIDPKSPTLSGKIELIHLDARIQFKLHTGTKVTKFEPKEWQVCNVPIQSYLIGQGKTSEGTPVKDSYANSYIYNNQTIHAEKDDKGGSMDMYTFQFYQFENSKNAKGDLADPKEREKEDKNPDGTNTGTFKYVEPNATYVQFKAYMELIVQDKTQKDIVRVATITVKVLLGGKNKEGDAFDVRNFNTWRNQKYTYNITINDVDDIVKEVEVEGSEPRPGIEGDVIDAVDQVRILDAHYNCFNITLTAEEVEKLSILVHTPFDEVKYDTEGNTERPTGSDRDYKWIKFKYLGTDYRLDTPGSYTRHPLATYPGDNGEGLLDIFSLREDVKRRVLDNGGSLEKKHHYTVFVDEYYYKNKSWTEFVNKEDRYMMLSFPKKSTDQASSYARTRYFIKQKSIQTYYSTSTLTDNKTALGMEHVNESSYLTWKDQSGLNLENGYLNCFNYFNLSGTSWKDYQLNDNELYPGGPSSPGRFPQYTYFYSIGTDADNGKKGTFELKIHDTNAQCLSRNRDKNGNGTIDPDEIEWYVPTFKQISGMYLGAKSLSSPLFTPSSEVIYSGYYTKYHFATSDYDKIWAEEGCSNQGITADSYLAGQVRCVRNLGLTADASKAEAPKSPYLRYENKGHYVFDMKHIELANIRHSKSIKLGFHENFKDSRNQPYSKFELAKEFYKESKLPGARDTWGIYYGYDGKPGLDQKGKDLCQEYYEGAENDPERGKDKWRTPNQRELLIIFNGLGIEDKTLKEMIYTEDGITYGMLACTYWQYDNWSNSLGKGYRIFAIHSADKHLYLDNGVYEGGGDDYSHFSKNGTILRCVRDID